MLLAEGHKYQELYKKFTPDSELVDHRQLISRYSEAISQTHACSRLCHSGIFINVVCLMVFGSTEERLEELCNCNCSIVRFYSRTGLLRRRQIGLWSRPVYDSLLVDLDLIYPNYQGVRPYLSALETIGTSDQDAGQRMAALLATSLLTAEFTLSSFTFGKETHDFASFMDVIGNLEIFTGIAYRPVTHSDVCVNKFLKMIEAIKQYKLVWRLFVAVYAEIFDDQCILVRYAAVPIYWDRSLKFTHEIHLLQQEVMARKTLFQRVFKTAEPASII